MDEGIGIIREIGKEIKVKGKDLIVNTVLDVEDEKMEALEISPRRRNIRDLFPVPGTTWRVLVFKGKEGEVETAVMGFGGRKVVKRKRFKGGQKEEEICKYLIEEMERMDQMRPCPGLPQVEKTGKNKRLILEIFGGEPVKRSVECDLVIKREEEEICQPCQRLRPNGTERPKEPKEEVVSGEDEDWRGEEGRLEQDQEEFQEEEEEMPDLDDEDEEWLEPEVDIKDECPSDKEEENGEEEEEEEEVEQIRKRKHRSLRGKRPRKHEERKFPCDLCDRVFARKGFLSRHLRFHDGPDKVFKVRKPFKKETRKFNCHICGVVLGIVSIKFPRMPLIKTLMFTPLSRLLDITT